MKKLLPDFSRTDKLLWGCSCAAVIISYALCGGGGLLSPAAALIGVTSLIFAAKGHFGGPVLMVAFSIMYGIISYTFRYYGEMLTYLGMTGPMAVLAAIAWIRNPMSGSVNRVQAAKLRKYELWLIPIVTALVTGVFTVLLWKLGTSNLLPSSISVATSFAAVWLTERRSPYFALVYALNDVVLIILWTLASLSDRSYISVTVCFAVFLINDIYGFVSWRR